jgi:hypothetical protein
LTEHARVVRVPKTDEPYEVVVQGADPLGAHFVIRRLRMPNDDRELCYGYLSWTGTDLVVVVQDPEHRAHDVERRDLLWSFSGYDFTPLDEPTNTERAAHLIVEVARDRLHF